MPVSQELFNDEILRVFCSSYIHDPQGPVHLLIKGLLESKWYRQLSPPLMGRLLHAQLQWDPKNRILAPLHYAIEYIMQKSSGDQEKRLQMSQIICEVVAERLHWKSNKSLGFVILPAPGDIGIGVHKEDPAPDRKEYIQNAFSAAIVLKKLDIIQSLMTSDQKIDINHENRYFGRPLQLAAASGCSEVVDMFLDHGADPSIIQIEQPQTVGLFYIGRLSEGSALRVAARAGHTQIVRKLLSPKYLESISETEYCLTIIAAASGCHENIVLRLLEMIPEAWRTHSSWYRAHAFKQACYSGCEALVRSMLANGFNINESKLEREESLFLLNLSPIRIAMHHGHAHIVRLLLENGAKPDYISRINNYPPFLWEAVARGHEEAAIQVMLDNGIDVNDHVVHYAFCTAASCGQVHILQMLLRLGLDHSRGVDLSYHPTTGVHALLMALRRRLLSTVEFLASAGVPLNSDEKEYDAVYEATLHGNHDIRAVLFRYGAHDKWPVLPDIRLSSGSKEYVGLFVPDRVTYAWFGKY
jgi:ankyrin repeat protein